jgi:hypothetical protein
MSAEEPSGQVGARDRSSVRRPTSQPEGEDLTSITRIEGSDTHDTPTSPDQAIRELERRLREQAEHNARLDTEVRYLLQELAIRKEFITHIESQIDSMHALAGEFVAYRARISHRFVDRLVARVHRLPWLYRPLKRIGRAAVLIVTSSRPRNAPAMVSPRSDESDRPTAPSKITNDEP